MEELCLRAAAGGEGAEGAANDSTTQALIAINPGLRRCCCCCCCRARRSLNDAALEEGMNVCALDECEPDGEPLSKDPLAEGGFVIGDDGALMARKPP